MRESLRLPRDFICPTQRNPNPLIFHSRRDPPLRETNVLHDGLHPALKALGLPQAGMHAFRHGCNRRWELSGLNSAVIRQQMGHSSAVMTARDTGEIPLPQVRAAFSRMNGFKVVALENMENAAVAYLELNLERAMGIEPTSEAWEASILPLYDARSPVPEAIIHKSNLRRKGLGADAR